MRAGTAVACTRDSSQLLLEINAAILSHAGLSELLNAVSACLRRELKHDFAAMTLYQPETNQLRSYRLVTLDKIPSPVLLPLHGTIGGLVFRSRRPMIFRQIDFSEFPEDPRLESAGVKSACGVPLMSHGQTLGTLGLASLQEDGFSDEDVSLLAQIANQVAIAVENARNFERAESLREKLAIERDRLRLLLDINNAVVSHLDLRELVKSISESLRGIIPHEGAFLTLLNPERTRLRVQALELHPTDAIPFEEGVMIALEGTPEGEAIASRKPVLVVPQIDLERFFSPWVKKAFDNGLRSGCAVPLIAHGRPLGALSVVSVREAAFNQEHAELLQQCSKQIAIAVENALAYREIEGTKNKLAQEKLYLEDEIRTECNFEEIVGESPALRQILKQIEKVAPTDSTILIRGETGTGKELIARAIHNLSSRRERTLVKVNCAAIPMGLLESELFGHERGAFTGAIAQRIGRFELANHGTLFLDEVATFHWNCNPSCYACCRSNNLNVSAAPARSR